MSGADSPPLSPFTGASLADLDPVEFFPSPSPREQVSGGGGGAPAQDPNDDDDASAGAVLPRPRRRRVVAPRTARAQAQHMEGESEADVLRRLNFGASNASHARGTKRFSGSSASASTSHKRGRFLDSDSESGSGSEDEPGASPELAAVPELSADQLLMLKTNALDGNLFKGPEPTSDHGRGPADYIFDTRSKYLASIRPVFPGTESVAAGLLFADRGQEFPLGAPEEYRARYASRSAAGVAMVVRFVVPPEDWEANRVPAPPPLPPSPSDDLSPNDPERMEALKDWSFAFPDKPEETIGGVHVPRYEQDKGSCGIHFELQADGTVVMVVPADTMHDTVFWSIYPELVAKTTEADDKARARRGQYNMTNNSLKGPWTCHSSHQMPGGGFDQCCKEGTDENELIKCGQCGTWICYECWAEVCSETQQYLTRPSTQTVCKWHTTKENPKRNFAFIPEFELD
jgi:hypothetical protein